MSNRACGALLSVVSVELCGRIGGCRARGHIDVASAPDRGKAACSLHMCSSAAQHWYHGSCPWVMTRAGGGGVGQVLAYVQLSACIK